MPLRSSSISSFSCLMSPSASLMRLDRVPSCCWRAFFWSSVLSSSALQNSIFSSSSACSCLRDAIILSTISKTFSKPCFFPRKASNTRFVAVPLWVFSAAMALARTARSVVWICSKLVEGRVFLNNSRASSELSILMVSAIATASSARDFLASSWSAPAVLHLASSSARNFSSASLVFLVSSRSPFLFTASTARSPDRAVFSSMASVLAWISLFFACTMPLWLATASFSSLVISAKFSDISSRICFKIPTICPLAGS
mmetsp:Transcript_42235/g.101613  ORF Transcript_42235/g.101613 Transcript_42235/m.101613 type:complete len:257 (+) Transcript_42235:362-1132(+)